MTNEHGHLRTGRRAFLKASALAAASGTLLAGTAKGASEQAATNPLPTIRLGEHEISRLVAGWNPIGGHSHSSLTLAKYMREYYTLERTIELLKKCENEGITAWQYDHTEKAVAAIAALNAAGSKIKRICLHAERPHDAPLKKVIADTGPIAIVHHGVVTDTLFQAGKHQQVHDFVKKVHDHGLLAGVSAHNPDNVKRIADEGWENDLFMTCFYYINRSREEQEQKLGKVAVGEPYYESDPQDMTAVMRQVRQPCLGFKILAAGRLCWNKRSVEKAFQFAFENVKPSDGVIVGMFPVFDDEIRENAKYTRKYGSRR